MATGLRPKNWPSLPPATKPATKADSRLFMRDQPVSTRPVPPDSRERRQPYYHTLDWARGIDRDRGWDMTEGRDRTKGVDRTRGRDRTGTFRS